MSYNKNSNSFNNETEYNYYKTTAFAVTPNVAYIEKTGDVKYQNEPFDNGFIFYGKFKDNVSGDFRIIDRVDQYNNYIQCHSVNFPGSIKYNFYATSDDVVGTITELSNKPFSQNYQYIEEIYRWDYDTSNVTAMNSMFNGFERLKYANLHGLRTDSVTNMGNMFNSCKALKSLDLSSFDTSNVQYMDSMFYYCGSLEALDLSSFDTTNVNDMSSMFENTSSLIMLDLSSFDTTNVTNMYNMFRYCGCKYLKLSSSFFNSTTLRTYDFSSLFNWQNTESLAIFVDAITAHNGTGKTVSLSQQTKNALTQTQKDAITTAGWAIQ